MNDQAIVIAYVGRQPSPSEMSKIVDFLLKTHIAITSELLDVKHFDSDSISKAILVHANAFKTERANFVVHSEETTPLKEACIFVAESFKEFLPSKNDNKTYVNFMLEFQKRLTEASIKISTGRAETQDIAIVNAAKELCENGDKVDRNMLHRTGINNLAIQIIKSIAKQII
jgi:hypothetical protein